MTDTWTLNDDAAGGRKPGDLPISEVHKALLGPDPTTTDRDCCVEEEHHETAGGRIAEAARDATTDPTTPTTPAEARKRVEEARCRLFARIIASAHLLDTPFTNAPDQSPWTRLKQAMGDLKVALAELDAARATPPERQPSALDEAAHSVWLHGTWRWLTKQMTTEEREAFADAVDRVKHRHNADDPELNASPIDRWWRDDAPLSTTPPAGTVGER